MSNRHIQNGMDRREFLKAGGMATVALTLGTTGIFSLDSNVMAKSGVAKSSFRGYGPLVQDPGGVLDLPQGFQYRIISQEGGKLGDGRPIAGAFDGMAAFKGPHNSTILVRNHELGSNADYPVIGKNAYDNSVAGGTSTLIVTNNDHKVVREYISSAGTVRNCAGGATPWGTWLTCEETSSGIHGYVFEVNPNDPENEMSKTPIRDMGFFSHEACAIDPSTGIVYLTEDAKPSFLYRFIPNNHKQKLGALHEGGTLQAAALEEISTASSFNQGQKFGIIWKDIKPEQANQDAQEKGCIQFSRLEGAYFAGGVFWFDDTSAGEKKLGRIYRYTPATNTLELFFEASDANEMEMPDNICVTPWGDLWFVEDGPGIQRIMGVTPDGQVYQFAENKLNGSEFAGPTFSTKGDTFFVNIQSPGITFAIWGPFARQNPARQRQLGYSVPPKHFAPLISDKLAEFAESQGMTELEAAALQRLGMPTF